MYNLLNFVRNTAQNLHVKKEKKKVSIAVLKFFFHSHVKFLENTHTPSMGVPEILGF